MDTRTARNPGSWFRSRGGRRFGVEFAAIVLLKLLALIAIWLVCFREPRPDTRPAAIERHLLTPANVESPHDR